MGKVEPLVFNATVVDRSFLNRFFYVFHNYCSVITLHFSLQYIQDLQCPLDGSDRLAVCDWILGHAIRLEFGEKGNKLNLFLCSQIILKVSKACCPWLYDKHISITIRLLIKNEIDFLDIMIVLSYCHYCFLS